MTIVNQCSRVHRMLEPMLYYRKLGINKRKKIITRIIIVVIVCNICIEIGEFVNKCIYYK